MTPEQLRKAIAKGAPPAVCFLSGPEVLLKQEAIDALVASVPEATRAFNVQVFHAFEAELAEVLAAARTMPFLAPRRVIVLRDIEKLRQREQRGEEGGGDRGDLLAEYLAAPVPETVLAITTEDDEKAKTLVKRYGERWEAVAFRPLTGTALAAVVKAEAQRLGCAIEPAAVEALLEATGSDRGRAFNELQKLRSAVGAGGTIDREAVARYAAGYEHHGFFDIVDAIARRDLEASLRLLREVTIKEKEFLLLLGMLGKRLRVLWFLAAPPREVPKAYNVGWQVDKFRGDARRFTRAELERGLEALGRLDEAIKSTEVAPTLLLEHFLLGFLPGRR